jgi:hypothetical protein
MNITYETLFPGLEGLRVPLRRISKPERSPGHLTPKTGFNVLARQYAGAIHRISGSESGHHPLQPLLHQLFVRALRCPIQPFLHFRHTDRVSDCWTSRFDLQLARRARDSVVLAEGPHRQRYGLV